MAGILFGPRFEIEQQLSSPGDGAVVGTKRGYGRAGDRGRQTRSKDDAVELGHPLGWFRSNEVRVWLKVVAKT
jgi:hypothetical protein